MITASNTNTLNPSQAFRIPRYGISLLKAVFPPVAKRPKTKSPKAGQLVVLATPAPASLDPSLTPVCQAVGQRYPELWAGNWQHAKARCSGQPFESQSQADLALAGHIARECSALGHLKIDLFDAVEQVFSQSGLALRDKWLDRPDYRTATIGLAIDGCSALRDAVSGQLPLDSYGDMRNAKAFAHKWRGQLVHVTTRDAWLKWQNKRWSLCEKDEHIACAKACSADILASASAAFANDQEKGKKLIADAMAAHNLPKILAMLKMAVSEPNMAVTDRELDGNPMLLGVQNGVVALRKGQLLFNQPEMLVTRYCEDNYVDDMPCPRWESFLDQVFVGDVETIESVQRLLGYTLTGLVTEEVLVICFGYGSNGKSVFNNVVQRIIGGYSRTAPPSLLAARRADDSSPRNDLAALAGARYVSVNELQAGDRLDEQVVKQLAGREAIAARFLHKEFFEYMPTFTAWLRTNHKPIITGEDDGIWRRLVLVPFLRKFEAHEQDPQLEAKLMQERDGILMWMLEGTRMYLKEGLKLSPRIKSEAARYRKDSDLIGEFLADKTEADPNAKLNQGTLYEWFQEWCEANGLRQHSKKTFTQRLAERGFGEGRSNGERYYHGLKRATHKSPPLQGAV
jgi:putative DNA primase/helicase